jgi:hypothetical protein
MWMEVAVNMNFIMLWKWISSIAEFTAGKNRLSG